jgi:hypothetical protein
MAKKLNQVTDESSRVDYDQLAETYDQLKKALRLGNGVDGFKEGPITFQPTYRHLVRSLKVTITIFSSMIIRRLRPKSIWSSYILSDSPLAQNVTRLNGNLPKMQPPKTTRP